MLPAFSIDDVAHIRLGHPEACGNLYLKNSFCVKKPNLFYLLFRKFDVPMLTPSWYAAFLTGVLVVVVICSQKQMCGTAAWSVIAFVQYVVFFRYLSKVYLPRESVGSNELELFLFAKVQVPVTSACSGSVEYPTSPKARSVFRYWSLFVDTTPKTLFSSSDHPFTINRGEIEDIRP